MTLLKSDAGRYSADVTRTYPAGGTFSRDQRAIYDIVFAAQSETMPLMRPGHRFEIHDKAQEVVGRELLKLGLVTKNVPEQSNLYPFHAPGRPLGLQTHDAFDRQRTFEPNMVFTNEPGVYVRKDDVMESEPFKMLTQAEQQSVRAALDRYDGIGMRIEIEDEVLITAGDRKIRSAAASLVARDIEAVVATTTK